MNKSNAGRTPYVAKFRAPFAALGIRIEGGALTGIDYLPLSERAVAPTDLLARRVCLQVERYLADGGFRFDLPLAPTGTAFRRRVWDALSEIPAGESRTDAQLARHL